MTDALVEVGPPVEGKCNVVRKGKRCRQAAGYGTDHVGVGTCKHHGGSSPLARRSAADKMAEARAERALAQFGFPVSEVDAETVLLDLVAEAAGNVRWLGEQVNALANGTPNEGTGQSMWRTLATGYSKGSALFGPRIEVDKFGTEHVVGEDERAMVKLYGQWSDRLAKYAKAALDAGIEKRRVEMAEQQGETIVIVINNVLINMGLTDEQVATARRLVAQEFRQLEAGEA